MKVITSTSAFPVKESYSSLRMQTSNSEKFVPMSRSLLCMEPSPQNCCYELHPADFSPVRDCSLKKSEDPPKKKKQLLKRTH